MSDQPTPLTTASALARFRKELIEHGVSDESIDNLMGIALGQILRDEGLCVREEVSA